MTLLTGSGEGPSFPYAGRPMHVPIPLAHDGFDEAIYVLSGRLQVLSHHPSREAAVGAITPRGSLLVLRYKTACADD